MIQSLTLAKHVIAVVNRRFNAGPAVAATPLKNEWNGLERTVSLPQVTPF